MFKMTEKMVAPVGFRNLIVHEYGKIDLKKVCEIAHRDIDDLERYLRAIFEKCGIGDNCTANKNVFSKA